MNLEEFSEKHGVNTRDLITPKDISDTAERYCSQQSSEKSDLVNSLAISHLKSILSALKKAAEKGETYYNYECYGVSKRIAEKTKDLLVELGFKARVYPVESIFGIEVYVSTEENIKRFKCYNRFFRFLKTNLAL